jgi:AraC-like DNA-binding protein
LYFIILFIRAKLKKSTLPVLLTVFLFVSFAYSQKLVYEKGPLVLKANSLEDGLGQFVTDDLPNVTPKNTIVLKLDATPLIKKMWNIALHDVELNLITNSYGTYFAAGRRYTDRVYTRDISFAGILGLNAVYPNEMMKSLRVTREVVAKMGYKVSTEEVIKEIDAPWDAITDDRKQIMAQFKSNSITRRTDDVVWVWAVDDLFISHPEVVDWKWFYTNGKNNFEMFYAPWYDKTDGLYKGQNTFQDLQSDGYPEGYSQADCVLLKSTSTNCLYYKLLKYVNDHIEEDNLNIINIADEFAMSRSTFFRKVKVITGTTGKEFIDSVRLKKAKALLTESDLNISEIAYAVGHSNPQYFSKWFKSHCKISPSEYILKYKV